jgi:hypothetical protein
MGFLMDGIGVLPEGARLARVFVTRPFSIALAILIPLLSWAVIQGLIWAIRWLVRRIRKPAIA